MCGEKTAHGAAIADCREGERRGAERFLGSSGQSVLRLVNVHDPELEEVHAAVAAGLTFYGLDLVVGAFMGADDMGW